MRSEVDTPSGIEPQLDDMLLQHKAILDNAAVGICFTRRRTFLQCNRHFFTMFGWSSDELVGKPTSLVFPAQNGFDDWVRTATPILRCGQRLETELLMRRRDGSIFWCRMVGRAVDPSDPCKGAIFITEDITERRHIADAQRMLLLEYQAILDNASLGVTFVRKHRFLNCNQRFSEMFGWSNEELIHQLTETLYPSPEDYNALVSMAKPILSKGKRFDTEVKMRRKDGSTFWCRLLAKTIDVTDYAKGTIYIAEDITERRRAQEALLRARDELEQRVQERTEELALANALLQAEIQERELAEQQIRYLAHHDALTGLPNRRLLEDRLERALALARRNGHLVAIQYIDLDCFKPINDRLGHRVGDLLLQSVATRLQALLRGVDTVSRVGGDEFILVLPEITAPGAAAEVARKVLTSLSQPHEIEGHSLRVTPSIGVSLFPLDGVDATTLLARADAAMYSAKEMGRGTWRMFAHLQLEPSSQQA